MKFDNNSTVVKIQMLKLIYLLIVAAFIAFAFSSDLWRYVVEHTGISVWAFSITLLSIYLLYYLSHIFKRSSFVMFDDDGNKIIVRHYNLNPFASKKISYEIPKDQLADFIESRSLFGIRHDITLVRRVSGGNAQYPSFSITSLSPQQKKKLLAALKFYSKKQ
jgi:hypothetical protein